MSAPLVSVITPAHDAGRFLRETLASVRAQTFTDWEMVVAENGSTDDTRELLAAAARADARVRVLTIGRPLGPAAARNAAIAEARGRYLAFLDADDLWLPEKLEAQLEFMRTTGAALTHTTFGFIDVAGSPIRRPHVALDPITYDRLLRRTGIGCLTVLLDRTQTGDVRMPDLPSHEDIALWLSILRRVGPARGLDRLLAQYRIVPGSVSSRPLRAASRMWRVYREVERLPLPRASWCFAQYAFWAALKRV